MTRPFADLLALRIDEPRRAAEVERRMRNRFSPVARPAPGWIVALAPLPGASLAIEDGYVILEGRDLFTSIPAALDNPATVARVPGDTTSVRFRPDGSALALRSVGGAVPLAIYEGDGMVAISTRLDWLARFAIPDPQIDALPLAMWVCGSPYLPEHRLFVRGARSVVPGGYATIDGGTRLGMWWAPPSSPQAIPRRALVRERDERFRTLVIDGLSRDLATGSQNLLTLSGGSDSSTLAILAASLGRPLSALTLLTGSPQEREREMRIVSALKERIRFKTHHWVDGNKEQLSLTRGPLPVTFPVLHPALLALPRQVAHDPPVTLFGGEFADEFWGVFAMPDWIASMSLAGLVRTAGRYPNGWKDPLRWVRAKTRPQWSPRQTLPDFVREPLREEYRMWRDARMQAAEAGPWRSLSIRLEMFEPVAAMNWEACAPLGIRRVFPLVSRALLELTFASHPSEFLGPGFKTRQRRAFRGLVPAMFLDRAKAPFSHSDADPVPNPDPGAIEQILDPSRATPIAALAAAAFVESLKRASQAGECLTEV